MKLSKFTLIIFLIILIIFVIFVGWFGYFIGQHNASLAVRNVSPKQIAESMHSDNFYGEYQRTMLLITGKVKKTINQGQDTLVSFETTNTPSILGTVTCDLGRNLRTVKIGGTIKVLS